MSALTSHRRRAQLALGTSAALVAASLLTGVGPALADTVPPGGWATVTGHAPQSPDNNQVAEWCGSDSAGEKIEPVNSSPYQLQDDYTLVVVKAGSNQAGNNANTLFGDSPSQRQWVWADTDGDSNPEVGGDDKDSISHIIVCYDNSTPPGYLTAVKEWKVTGVDSDATGTPGTLTFNDETKMWDTSYEYPTGTQVTVAEAGDGTAPDIEGYRCTLNTEATTYQVDDGDPSPTTPTVTISSGTDVTVTITNTATCEVVTPPATTLSVTKAWVYDGTPAGYPVLSSADAGTLTVTVDGAATGQAWNTTQAGLKVGDKFTVTEGTVPTPPQMAGYTCQISGSPAYSVNGAAFVSPAPTVPLAPSPNTVVVQNTVTCTADEVVGGIEEGGEVPEETPTGTTDDGTVGGTEDELAATGANTGPAGLGLLLILSGAALLVGRRFATR